MSSPECDMFEAYYNGTMALLDGLQFTNTMFAQYHNDNTDKPWYKSNLNVKVILS